MPAVTWEQRAEDLEPTSEALSSEPLHAVRRLQEDLGRAINDAREHGASDPQIELRLRDWADGIRHRMETS